MPVCTAPIDAWRALPEASDQRLRFTPSRAAGADQSRPLQVPCNRCDACKITRRAAASTRGWCELMMHGGRGMFVNLTIADEHMPPDHGVDKRRIQKLHKDMRNEGLRFRFQCAAEYSPADDKGRRTRDDSKGFRLACRPHYHINYFGFVFEDLKPDRRDEKGKLQYRSATLSRLWPEGRAPIYPAAPETVGYSSGYLFKDAAEDPDFLRRTRVDPYTGEILDEWFVPPQFLLQSMRPGLGGGYVDHYGPGAFEGGFVVRDGKKVAIPRYMLERLKATHPDDYERLKDERREAFNALIDTSFGVEDRLLKRHEFGEVARREHLAGKLGR